MINTACRDFPPITYSGNRDTAMTIEQVQRHNARWECLCNKSCPKE